MGTFTQCRADLGSIQNKYPVTALLSRLRPPCRVQSPGRTQATEIATPFRGQAFAEPSRTQLFLSKQSHRRSMRRAEDARGALVQSAARIPTSSAADTNARRATGGCASPRITPRQAIIAALRLAVSRGNAFSRISAALLTSTIVRSLPPVRIVTGRSNRFAFSGFVVRMLLPQADGAHHAQREPARGRAMMAGDNWPLVIARREGASAHHDHKLPKLLASKAQRVHAEASGQGLAIDARKRADGIFPSGALGLLGQFPALQEYKSSTSLTSVQGQGKADPTLPTVPIE